MTKKALQGTWSKVQTQRKVTCLYLDTKTDQTRKIPASLGWMGSWRTEEGVGREDSPANGLAWARSATQSEKSCDPSVVFKRSGWRGKGSLLCVLVCVYIKTWTWAQ